MKANLKSYSSVILILMLLFSCDNKQTKLPEVNTTKSKDTTSSVKRQTDSTKIAFSDIEFGMSAKDLLYTQTFKSRSSKDLKTGSLEDSYVMKHTLESNNIPKSLLKQENIIRENDIQTIEIIDKIGLYKYYIKATLIKNSISLVQIRPWSENEGLENIVKIISLKYGAPIKHKTKKIILTKEAQRLEDIRNSKSDHPQVFYDFIFSNDCKEIPSPYCLYEWKLKNKSIEIFSYYLQEDYQGRESNLLKGWKVVNTYIVEIYCDITLSDIIKTFKQDLRNIENIRNKRKAKDSEKF